MNEKLKIALENTLWTSHTIGDKYRMDGKGSWNIAYYPLMGCGKTQEAYSEPRALIEAPSTFGGVKGIDFREVPMRYLERINRTTENY